MVKGSDRSGRFKAKKLFQSFFDECGPNEA
jgi:hypothetical protein